MNAVGNCLELFRIFIISHKSFSQNPSNQIRKCLIGVRFLDDVINGLHEEPKFPAIIHIVVFQGIQAQQLKLHQEFLGILKGTQ